MYVWESMHVLQYCKGTPPVVVVSGAVAVAAAAAVDIDIDVDANLFESVLLYVHYTAIYLDDSVSQ